MAKVRVLRRQEKAYIELPSEMAGQEELELFALKDGYYLLTMPLGLPPGQQTQKQKEGISEIERTILRKLLAIRFEKRTPEYVSKALSEREKEVLKALEQKGFVNVFKGDKYKDGVYNIRDSIYPLLSQKQDTTKEAGPERRAEAAQAPMARPQSTGGAFSILNTRGFIIVQDKREAMMLSEQMTLQMKKGEVVGVKGFDGRFYIVTRDYLAEACKRINSVLKEDMDAPSIASAAKLDPDGCVAALRLMAENGDVIERKRGVFAPV
ncbi:hypothetical protein H0O00_02990 [Candidatus Micrarchaeota archaeon]|nr:hypothetical protein [Candidatus Micrarchaeota archaeon]